MKAHSLISSRNKHERSFPRYGLTKHPRGWGVGLNLLWGDFLNDVPQLPRHLGPEDVKGLVGMQLAVALIVLEEAVVGALVPLKEKEMVFSRRGTCLGAPSSEQIPDFPTSLLSLASRGDPARGLCSQGILSLVTLAQLQTSGSWTLGVLSELKGALGTI